MTTAPASTRMQADSGTVLEKDSILRGNDATDDALKRLFGVDGKVMLTTVLGDEADPVWQNYRRLAEFRNQIVHKGRRGWYRTVGDVVQDRRPAEQRIVHRVLNDDREARDHDANPLL